MSVFYLITRFEKKECFNSIKKEPFKIPVDDGNEFMLTFFNPIREGWLWKQGGRYKTWKRRWFILNDGCLYYFELTAVSIFVRRESVSFKIRTNLKSCLIFTKKRIKSHEV